MLPTNSTKQHFHEEDPIKHSPNLIRIRWYGDRSMRQDNSDVSHSAFCLGILTFWISEISIGYLIWCLNEQRYSPTFKLDLIERTLTTASAITNRKCHLAYLWPYTSPANEHSVNLFGNCWVRLYEELFVRLLATIFIVGTLLKALKRAYEY